MCCQPRKRILIINQYYPPDRSATAGILERMAKAISIKNKVTILSGRPSYMASKRYKWKIVFIEKDENKLNVVRVGSSAFERYNLLKRILNYLTFLILSFPVALVIRADLIVSMTDPPLAGLIGMLVAKIKSKPFVYYIQDIHPDIAVASGMIRNGIITKLWGYLHTLILKSADRIIVIGDDMRDRLIKKGIDSNNIIVIRHGSNNSNGSHSIDIIKVKDIRGESSVTFVHAGNLGNYGAWDQLVDAIKIINNEKIGFVFIGEGQRKKTLIESCAGIKNIKFMPYQPREMLPSVLAAGDVHIITIKNDLEGLVVPSKIYPILASNKSILAICSEKSDAARIISRFGCGLIANPDSVESIVGAILKMSSNKGALEIFGKNAGVAAECYNKEKLLRQFSKEVDSFLHAGFIN